MNSDFSFSLLCDLLSKTQTAKPNVRMKVNRIFLWRPINGLQVNGFNREFTKSFMIRDFDDVLKNPLRYVHLFLLHKSLSRQISENRQA